MKVDSSKCRTGVGGVRVRERQKKPRRLRFLNLSGGPRNIDYVPHRTRVIDLDLLLILQEFKNFTYSFVHLFNRHVAY